MHVALLSLLSSFAHAAPPTPTFQLQTWATAMDQDLSPQADPAGYGDPEHDVGLGIARARIGLEGEEGAVHYAFTIGSTSPFDGLTASTPLVDIVSAYAGVKHAFGAGSVVANAGTQRVPFGRERLVSSKDLLFEERSVSSQWISPGYGLGLATDVTLNMGLRFRGGVFNSGGNLYGDDSNGLLLSGRFEWSNGNMWRGYRTQPGTFGVGFAGMHNSGLSVSTNGLTADLFARIGPIQLIIEGGTNGLNPVVPASITAPQVLGKTTHQGWMAQLSYIADLEQGGLELGARFSVYDDNTAVDNNGDVGVMHVGLTRWDIRPGVDLGAGFIHRAELGGRTLPNDTARLWAQVHFPAS